MPQPKHCVAAVVFLPASPVWYTGHASSKLLCRKWPPGIHNANQHKRECPARHSPADALSYVVNVALSLCLQPCGALCAVHALVSLARFVATARLVDEQYGFASRALLCSLLLVPLAAAHK